MGKENPINFGNSVSDLVEQKTQQKKDKEEKERNERERKEEELKIKKDAEIESAKQFKEKCDQVLIPIFEQLLSSMGEGRLHSWVERNNFNYEEYCIKYEWDWGYDLDYPSLELGGKEISIHVVRHHESCDYSILKIFKKEREIKLIKKDALIVKELSTQKEAAYVDLRWPIWEKIVSLKDVDIQKKIEEWILKELHKKI